MSKGLRTSLIVLVIVVGSAAVLLVGLNLASLVWGFGAGWPASMMAGVWSNPNAVMPFGYGPGRVDLGAYGPGPGMMGSGAYGPGMMGPGASGIGMMGGGMMGASGLFGIQPLSLEQAESALNDYLSSLGDQDLTLGEIMIFDNHAYAVIVEASTGIGAMEVLVDPVTLAVYPEHGPNMMWNLAYSPMAGYGGMMGWFRAWPDLSRREPTEPSADMPVSPEQAFEAAQRYLDLYLPGAEAEEHTDAFYGYYTLHILRDGEIAGMLSVNGYSGQVFLHTWHGDFIEMSEEA